MRIVLASASPRRREILEQIGIKYDVCVSEVDEHSIEKDPKKLVMLLSERKAMAVLKALESGKSGLDADPETESFCVIGCDTLVYQERVTEFWVSPIVRQRHLRCYPRCRGECTRCIRV